MLSLPAIFSDHMVFQREKNILLWGESDEKNVTAVIDEKKVSSDVNNGRWEIELPPMAAGGPYELEVSDGVQTKKYTDIMIGEVWLAGGQSNMELELQNSMNGQEVCANVKDDGVKCHGSEMNFLKQKKRVSGSIAHLIIAKTGLPLHTILQKSFQKNLE